MGDRVGLLWIGTAFYPTPEDFIKESNEQGISRRIKAVPRGFVVGEHFVFLAHPKVKQVTGDDGKPKWIGGVFRIFRPDRIDAIAETGEVFADDAALGLEAYLRRVGSA